MSTQSIILFDGVCNFCNSSVNFVIRRDSKNRFQFAALQSNTGKALLKQYHLPENQLDSFVLIEDNEAHTQSTGALKVCKHLSGAWPIFYVFILIPAFIRNGIYHFIAKNRYKWFGKKDACMIPTSAVKSKFLD